MIRFCVFALFALVVVDSASGQLFRRNRQVCNTGVCAPIHHKQLIPIVDGGSDTIVINNSYPAPIAPQGASIYGYGYSGAGQYNLQSHFSVDPNQLMREAARLTDNAANLHSQALVGYQTSADQLSKAALDNQRIALAADMLGRLGVGQPLANSTGSFSSIQSSNYSEPAADGSIRAGECIRICPDGNGGLKIFVDSEPQAAAENPYGQIPDASALFASKCATCHDVNSDIPFVDAGGALAISSSQRDKIVAAIQSGQMPPAANAVGQSIPRLSATDKTSLVDWLNSLN